MEVLNLFVTFILSFVLGTGGDITPTESAGGWHQIPPAPPSDSVVVEPQAPSN